jgi:hypothetical protein
MWHKFFQGEIHILARSIGFEAIVPCEDTQIHLEMLNPGTDVLGQARKAIYM